MRLFLAVVLLTASASQEADACGGGPPPRHEIDESLQATDTLPPARPVLSELRILRGMGADSEGCRQTASSCDDLGWVSLALATSDDQTPVDELGWRVVDVLGSPPPSLHFDPDYAFRGDTTLEWIDGASNDQEAVSFTVRVVAVDLAGNESEPIDVLVEDGGAGGGCQAGGRRCWPGHLLLIVVSLSILSGRRWPRRGRRS